MEYTDKLIRAVRQSESVLCVGLDPNPDLIPDRLKTACDDDPERYIEAFCAGVIESTSDHCCAYKPNLAFFESIGAQGLAVFERVLSHIPDDKIIIADAKRGDIGSTAEQYSHTYFKKFNCDAITLNPLMGFDTLDPFLTDESKAVYSLVLTSNPGSNDLLLRRFEGRHTLAEYIAGQLQRKMEKSRAHIGMVVGATHPNDFSQVLDTYPGASLLIPGIGSQGGRSEDLISHLQTHQGVPLISASRSVIYAGGESPHWQKEVSGSALKLKEELKPLSKRYS